MVGDIENIPRPVFDNMFTSLVFICLEENDKLFILRYYTWFFILVFGTFIISFLLLLYLLDAEFSILHSPPTILIVLIKNHFRNHPVSLFLFHMNHFICPVGSISEQGVNASLPYL